MRRALLLIAVMILMVLLASCSEDAGVRDPHCLAAGSEETVSASPGKVKVIILSGQSNASGCAPVSAIPEAEKYSNGFDNVLIRCKTDSIEKEEFIKTVPSLGTAEGYFGPELGMAEILSKAFAGETIYLVKYTKGATTLANEFYPSYEREESVCFRGLVDWVDSSLQMLREQGLDPEIIAFAWMQGESDTFQPEGPGSYFNNELLFINELRSRFAEDSLPGGFFFIDAGITQIWQNYQTINNAKYRIATSTQRCVFINSNRYKLVCQENDINHFNSRDMIKLGNLFGIQIEERIR